VMLLMLVCHDRWWTELQLFPHSLARVSGHPLAQNEKSLHEFLQSVEINKDYVPGKMRAK
jgi:hypothetical protein